MTTPTAPMTKIDAVNLMLASVGQSPLNTISGTIPKEGSKAVLALDNALREVCLQGWSFNQDTDYPLTPSSGKIAIPAGAGFVDPSHGQNYTMRWDTAETAALRVYDNDKRSFDDFGTAAIDFNIIWLFEYEQVPQHVRQYVATKAGRKFQSGIMGSTILYEFTREMETEAYAAFRRIEKRQKQYNINRYRSGATRRYSDPR